MAQVMTGSTELLADVGYYTDSNKQVLLSARIMLRDAPY